MSVSISRRNLWSAALATPFAALLNQPLAAQERPESLIWSPDSIRWDRTDPDGTKYAVIDGDRERPGQPFTYAFWMPDGVWVKAHTHTQQAHVAVVKGTLLLGFGKKMDQKATKAVKTGEFFIVRAGVPHFEGSRGETLIIGSALGGWKTTPLE
ncbi:MAG: cupin domain-containing protein [Acidobacteria bacterium]|nr:cupin domain-containing protein [Acidobacteriota bacterium]